MKITGGGEGGVGLTSEARVLEAIRSQGWCLAQRGVPTELGGVLVMWWRRWRHGERTDPGKV